MFSMFSYNLTQGIPLLRDQVEALLATMLFDFLLRDLHNLAIILDYQGMQHVCAFLTKFFSAVSDIYHTNTHQLYP